MTIINNMQIKSIKAKNFFSIGEEPIFIDFTKYSNIVLLKGKNYDADKENPTSNGSGKSTISESLTYALYGKTIRNLSHADIINKKSKKGLEVEICFDNYRVLRTRKPDNLRLWKDDIELTLGGIPATQDLLNNIIKLEYTSFINVACFGQHNSYDFLSVPPATKRKIVENLLSLEKHIKFSEIAKEDYKNINGRIKEIKIQYESLLDNKSSYCVKLDQIISQENSWVSKKKEQLAECEKLIEIKQNQLSLTDAGNEAIQYENAQLNIKEKSQNIATYELHREKCNSAIQLLYEKLSTEQFQYGEVKNIIKNLDWENDKNNKIINNILPQIKKLSTLQDGAKCNSCMGTISRENYEGMLNNYNLEIQDVQTTILSTKNTITSEIQKLSEIKYKIDKISEKQSEIKNKIKQIDGILVKEKQGIKELMCIKMPNVDQELQIIQEQVSSLKNKTFELKHELNGGNPYKQIISTIQKELEDVSGKIKSLDYLMSELSVELSYYDFWIDGFSENGIRSIIINDIIPALNNRISYYLYYLVDDTIKIEFDNNLNETISRNPYTDESFVYHSLSGGEKKLIDFAISQSFAYITAISSGNMPNILYLDEVGEFVDEKGLNGIVKLINQISQDRQVFITTHNPILLDLFNNCETLTIVKKDGFSRLEE